MQMMKAATIIKPGEVQLQSVKVPEPGPGEVLLALEGSGVCASNLPLWHGAPWFNYPIEPGSGGHEGWGVVERVGEGVDRKLEGRRVAALSYKAYAQYDVARVEHLVELPPGLAGVPFPGEALGCAVNIFRRSDIRNGHTVAIVGVGFLGALLVKLAVQAGAQVLALSRRPYALEIAQQMGAHQALVTESRGAAVESVRDLTRGVLCDRVIEATGKQEPLDLSSELVREHGKLVIAGYHQDGPRQVNMQLWNWRGIDVVNAHERDSQVSVAGMREAVRLVSEGVLRPEPLYKEFDLDQLGQAFDAAEQREERFMKALVRTSRGAGRS